MGFRGSGLRWAPWLAVAVMVGPVVAGLGGTLAPALGWMPSLGGEAFGLEPLRALLAWPGLGSSARLAVTTGLATTAIALGLTVLICAGWQGTRPFRALERLLAPLLAVPHAAAAFGLAFLIAPSGWIARGLSPWATGWDRPPDLLIVQDPLGGALVAGLVAKEVPFLLLMTLAALPQARSSVGWTASRALGYGPAATWVKTVFPLVYRQIRLPVYAVLAYATSVVDVAIVLGPTTPPPLSVQVVRWMNDPDLTLRFQAAAGAVLQLGLVVVALSAWRLGELAVARLGLDWIERGRRGRATGAVPAAGALGAGLVTGAVGLGLAGLVVWSVAGLWSFPDPWPDAFTTRTWSRHGPTLAGPALDTLLVAAVSTALALVLAVSVLEAEWRHGAGTATRALWLVYVPLLVPQVAFLTGLQMLTLTAGLDGTRLAVVATHVVFVLPYVLLSIGDPFRAWDSRYATVASALGAGPARVLWRVRLPMLLRPVLTATAVGLAVSVGQYLPTLLMGAGRIQTLTTEAVALASGGDRRAIGVYAVAQTAAAVLPFVAAVLVPRLVWHHRAALRDA